MASLKIHKFLLIADYAVQIDIKAATFLWNSVCAFWNFVHFIVCASQRMKWYKVPKYLAAWSLCANEVQSCVRQVIILKLNGCLDNEKGRAHSFAWILMHLKWLLHFGLMKREPSPPNRKKKNKPKQPKRGTVTTENRVSHEEILRAAWSLSTRSFLSVDLIYDSDAKILDHRARCPAAVHSFNSILDLCPSHLVKRSDCLFARKLVIALHLVQPQGLCPGDSGNIGDIEDPRNPLLMEN